VTIILVIKPEVEAELPRQAAAHGIGIDEYAVTLLEEAAQASSSPSISSVAAKDMVELFAPLRGLNLDFERDRDTGRDLYL
jgi:hypothetical protein